MKMHLVKRLVEIAASRGLKLLGVNGLVAGVASHLLWKFIIFPAVKHAHKRGGLQAHNGKKTGNIHIKKYKTKHGEMWHNLSNGKDYFRASSKVIGS